MQSSVKSAVCSSKLNHCLPVQARNCPQQSLLTRLWNNILADPWYAQAQAKSEYIYQKSKLLQNTPRSGLKEVPSFSEHVAISTATEEWKDTRSQEASFVHEWWRHGDVLIAHWTAGWEFRQSQTETTWVDVQLHVFGICCICCTRGLGWIWTLCPRLRFHQLSHGAKRGFVTPDLLLCRLCLRQSYMKLLNWKLVPKFPSPQVAWSPVYMAWFKDVADTIQRKIFEDFRPACFDEFSMTQTVWIMLNHVESRLDITWYDVCVFSFDSLRHFALRERITIRLLESLRMRRKPKLPPDLKGPGPDSASCYHQGWG